MDEHSIEEQFEDIAAQLQAEKEAERQDAIEARNEYTMGTLMPNIDLLDAIADEFYAREWSALGAEQAALSIWNRLQDAIEYGVRPNSTDDEEGEN